MWILSVKYFLLLCLASTLIKTIGVHFTRMLFQSVLMCYFVINCENDLYFLSKNCINTNCFQCDICTFYTTKHKLLSQCLRPIPDSHTDKPRLNVNSHICHLEALSFLLNTTILYICYRDSPSEATRDLVTTFQSQSSESSVCPQMLKRSPWCRYTTL